MASPRLVPGGAGLEGVVGILSASWAVTRIPQGDTDGHLVTIVAAWPLSSQLWHPMGWVSVQHSLWQSLWPWLSPVDLGPSVQAGGEIMPASQCRHEGQNERAWVQIPAAVSAQRRLPSPWVLATPHPFWAGVTSPGEGGYGGPSGHSATLVPHLPSSFTVAFKGNWPSVPVLPVFYDDLLITVEECIQQLGKNKVSFMLPEFSSFKGSHQLFPYPDRLIP